MGVAPRGATVAFLRFCAFGPGPDVGQVLSSEYLTPYKLSWTIYV
jgi:hypothetical protein